MKTKTIILLAFTFIVVGCPNDYYFPYDIIITDSAQNLTEINSEYDDFNSDLPYRYEWNNIYFSTNRNSLGRDFDIIAKKMELTYHPKDDVLNVTFPNEEPLPQADSILNSINLVEYTNWDNSAKSVISNPLKLASINDYGNNLYPSINDYGKSFYPFEDITSNELFFCSDRNDTVYNIYLATYNDKISKQSLINGDIKSIEKNSILSSSYDDKCPYVKNDLIVFTSNRKDGYGGYDLYYSRFVNNSWLEPLLFSNNFNSEYDDYRPIIFQVFGYDIMIFSSNRPQGKGGFDLYIGRIDNLIE